MRSLMNPPQPPVDKTELCVDTRQSASTPSCLLFRCFLWLSCGLFLFWSLKQSFPDRRWMQTSLIFTCLELSWSLNEAPQRTTWWKLKKMSLKREGLSSLNRNLLSWSNWLFQFPDKSKVMLRLGFKILFFKLFVINKYYLIKHWGTLIAINCYTPSSHSFELKHANYTPI